MYNLIAVDDEIDVKILFEHFFRKEEEQGNLKLYFEQSANGCLKLLEFLEGNTIVITDINMPDMTGVELLKIIHNKFPKIKVVLVSAYNKMHYADQLQGITPAAMVEKPVDFSRLKGIISDLAANF